MSRFDLTFDPKVAASSAIATPRHVTIPDDLLETIDTFAAARACQAVPAYVASNCLRFQSAEYFQQVK